MAPGAAVAPMAAATVVCQRAGAARRIGPGVQYVRIERCPGTEQGLLVAARLPVAPIVGNAALEHRPAQAGFHLRRSLAANKDRAGCCQRERAKAARRPSVMRRKWCHRRPIGAARSAPRFTEP